MREWTLVLGLSGLAGGCLLDDTEEAEAVAPTPVAACEGDFTPCGGDLVGSWEMTDACVINPEGPIGALLDPAGHLGLTDLDRDSVEPDDEIRSGCTDATKVVTEYSLSGSLEYTSPQTVIHEPSEGSAAGATGVGGAAGAAGADSDPTAGGEGGAGGATSTDSAAGAAGAAGADSSATAAGAAGAAEGPTTEVIPGQFYRAHHITESAVLTIPTGCLIDGCSGVGDALRAAYGPGGVSCHVERHQCLCAVQGEATVQAREPEHGYRYAVAGNEVTEEPEHPDSTRVYSYCVSGNTLVMQSEAVRTTYRRVSP